jgi:hypothetical protein
LHLIAPANQKAGDQSVALRRRERGSDDAPDQHDNHRDCSARIAEPISTAQIMRVVTIVLLPWLDSSVKAFVSFWLVEGKLKLDSPLFSQNDAHLLSDRRIALQVFFVAKVSVVPTINCE